jgi:ribosomal protein L13E
VLEELSAAGLKAADARVVGSAIEEGIRVLDRHKDILKKVPGVAEKL